MIPTITPNHHDVLVLTAQIAILLFTARTLGEIAQRLQQPSVVGELLAGILLGPSILGKHLPFLAHTFAIKEPAQGYLLEGLSLIGVMLLLLLTGFETDLKLISRKAKSVMGTALGGLVIPMISGFAIALLVPEKLLVDPAQRMVFALFLATAMSISAIPVIAKILIDMKLMRRDIGQSIIAAGMIDDTVGWTFLSIVTMLASGKILSINNIANSVGSVIVFILLSFTLARWILKLMLNFVQDEIVSSQRYISLVMITTFGWGAVGHLFGLEPMFGAFMIGIILGQIQRLPQYVHERIEAITMGIFAPIFFAIAGLKVNVANLMEPSLLSIAIIVLITAVLSKVLGAYAGARWIGRLDHWTSLSYGAALNARGAMGIIIATIGLSLGLINEDFFSIIVIMAIVTSLLAPLALRFTLRHVPVSEEEIARLKEEETLRMSPIARIHRVLLPVRSRDDSDRSRIMLSIKALMLQEIDRKSKCSVTLLSVVPPKTKMNNLVVPTPSKSLFPQKEVIPKMITGNDPVNAILDECHKDYDLLLLGASEDSNNTETLFSSVIDSLVRLSPCTTAIIHSKNADQFWSPKKILVPTDGSLAAKHAAEFAFLLSSKETQDVALLNVVIKDGQNWHAVMHDEIFERQLKNSIKMLEDLREAGQAKGIPTKAEVKVGTEPEQVILEIAQKENYDLIILGTDVLPASDRLFLGPRVERILKNASCPVLILNTI